MFNPQVINHLGKSDLFFPTYSTPSSSTRPLSSLIFPWRPPSLAAYLPLLCAFSYPGLGVALCSSVAFDCALPTCAGSVRFIDGSVICLLFYLLFTEIPTIPLKSNKELKSIHLPFGLSVCKMVVFRGCLTCSQVFTRLWKAITRSVPMLWNLSRGSFGRFSHSSLN
ncbi:hypothetical protein HDV57DRAFT_250363 [Trichoderma longibrachiatum]|uniref:Uncharacterized protein n=1 Tax=Trichoderma longibrachiatum ATCC 18648 TaxID=983965 RepID=A0A2T4C9P1_TRILO|nr:hypothetical protein M440DRAFT_1188391 [Trichoderma longibrachiatum ATCC 18648]